MILSFASPCLSRGSFSTVNARASESCSGAFFGELKALLGDIMWRTQLLSSTDRVCRKSLLPCSVLLATTNTFTTCLTIVDCLKSLACCLCLRTWPHRPRLCWMRVTCGYFAARYTYVQSDELRSLIGQQVRRSWIAQASRMVRLMTVEWKRWDFFSEMFLQFWKHCQW